MTESPSMHKYSVSSYDLAEALDAASVWVKTREYNSKYDIDVIVVTYEPERGDYNRNWTVSVYYWYN